MSEKYLDWLYARKAAAGFWLRRKFTGKLKLRAGLPTPRHDDVALREQAFYRLVLERAFGFAPELRDASCVVDVGCRNWSYAPALAQAFQSARFLAIEVDPNRRYLNLYRRRDYISAAAARLKRLGRAVEVEFEDFRNVPMGPALFVFFFPFVSAYPCVQWGLPLNFAKYEELVAHALRQGGALISCHQGEWEAEIARKVYQDAGLTVHEAVLRVAETKTLWPGAYDTYVFTAQP